MPSSRPWEPAREDVYATPRITVTYRPDGGRLFAVEVMTRDPADRTGDGIGIGSPARDVVQRVPGAFCRALFLFGAYCRRQQGAGAGGTFFRLAGGRVTSVAVVAPPY